MSLKICIIGGCGHVYMIFEGIAASKGQHVLCAYSGTEEDNINALHNMVQNAGIQAPYYTDYREMLDKEQPDICVVDNVFYRHSEAAAYALSKGITTFCEKPLAVSLPELDKVSSAAQSTGALLWAMQTARYDPLFYTARKLIKDGAIGDVLMLNGQKSYRLGSRPAFYHKRETFGGSIPWVAIHSIDTILSLVENKVESVYATHSVSGNQDHGELEASGQILLCFSDGVHAGINFDYLRPAAAPTHGDDRVRIAGTEGVLEVRAGQIHLIDKNGESQPELITPPSAWEAFADAHNGRPGLITTDSSIESTRIALLAREAADRDEIVKC